jgi:3-hydroxybutyryl-CoA dehydrogenase
MAATDALVAVVGAGTMGAGIARVAADAGHPVLLVDVDPDAPLRAIHDMVRAVERRSAQGRGDPGAELAAVGRITPVGSLAELTAFDVVIEAAKEDLGVKQDLFVALEAVGGPRALYATNTSSLDIPSIAAPMAHPERLVGMHFFNPPTRMRLVEVVHGETTGEAAEEEANAFATAWGKTTVRCTSTPGFIVNRVARPFYGEAQWMLAAGLATATEIDAALRDAGFRMGPLELTDLIGQDVNLAVGTSVWEQTGRDPRYEPTDLQRDLVKRGQLGRKSGIGVYTYGPGDEVVADRSADLRDDRANAGQHPDGADDLPPVARDVVARTLAMLVNEAVDLVERGEASAEDVDLAMQLGTNYPRGPIAWGREIGFDVVRQQLAELDAAHPGGRYRPSPGLSG